ncbi:Melibiose operon regulatory protein [Rubripirellula amarantea]|uniref:Melibiose operon regulatory protein n=1 Tax=Rubripirellula amarantea TaxID=2527999 RepID=A0A5C5WVY2_9BACT|nr:helix-turn-helix domain-containing protein [Rubripirellula amarantea]TWT54846.1 Melibiose operon regulatory protein [Rubripirellula amarantea]
MADKAPPDLDLSPNTIENEANLYYPEAMLHFDTDRPEFSPYGFTCEVWEPKRMQRPDRHDEIEINFLAEGSLTYLIGGSRVTVEPRTVTLFWAAVPHQIVEFRDVTHYYVITVPFGRFLQWGLPEKLQTQLIIGNVIAADTDETVSHVDETLFQQWHRDLRSGTDELKEIVLLELKARLLRLARAHHPRRAISVLDDEQKLNRASPNLEKAELMACYIARHYRSRLPIKEIAESVNLHPDYAANLFRRTFGTTLNTLITRHRIAEAQRLLITSDEQIVNVAFDSGFDSLSRFNRAFKELTGTTPRSFRKECRASNR